jgi:hypothetical protein
MLQQVGKKMEGICDWGIGCWVIGDSLLSYWLLGEGVGLAVGGSFNVFGYISTPLGEIR